jgi:uncharacterized protein DUF6962
MTEADVTITDFLLSVEAIAFALLIARAPTTPSQRWFVMFFGATAIASLAGGLVHGFLSDSKVLWRIVLIALGVVSAAAWAIGAQLLFTARTARVVVTIAWVEFVVYAFVVVFVTDAFLVAIANYLPSTLFLILAFSARYRTYGETPVLVGLAGLFLTLVAAAVQQSGIALHPKYFNHNALYHALQAIALFLIFRAAAFLSGASGVASR